MPKPPKLQAAVLCERVLIETDGAPSLIRVVDQFTIEVPPFLVPSALPPGVRLPLRATLFLSIKPSSKRAVNYKCELVTRDVDGQELARAPFSVEVAGGFIGANVGLPLQLLVNREGIHTLEVALSDGQILATVPFLVRFAAAMPEEPATPERTRARRSRSAPRVRPGSTPQDPL